MVDPSVETSLPPPAGKAVPQRSEELSAAWLTACLRHAGALGDGSVVSFTAERVGQGKGFAGHLARVEIVCDAPLPETPKRLIAKFASEQDAMRDMMGAVGGYEREVRFYREVAKDVGVPTPRCFLAHYDRAGGRFLLLLEDMAPAASPGMENGLSLEQARVVLEQLAYLHAHWWERTEGYEWMELTDDTVRRLRDAYQEALPRFLEKSNGRFPTIARIAVAIGFVFEGDEWIDQIRAGPRTLVHNDMHVENIFLPTEEGGRFAFIDWQGVSFAKHGTGDVTRILCMGMTTELRRAHANELLRYYHSKLRELGVRGYLLWRLRLRYREEIASLVVVAVLAFDAIDFEADENEALAEIVGTRCEAAVRDAQIVWVVTIVVLVLRVFRAMRRIVGLGPVKRL